MRLLLRLFVGGGAVLMAIRSIEGFVLRTSSSQNGRKLCPLRSTLVSSSPSSQSSPPEILAQHTTTIQERRESGIPKFKDSQQAEKWQELYKQTASKTAEEASLLRLQHDEEKGYRGVYLNHSVKRDQVVLSIPLSRCLCDDKPPAWLESSSSSTGWATRLAACVLERQSIQQQETRNDGDLDDESNHDLWLSLLPNEALLRASLPVHWSEDILKSAASTALELAVDTAYFTRAAAVQDLLDALEKTDTPWGSSESQRMCENALDIVQTRSCRATGRSTDDDNVASIESNRPPLRLLAPVFDFINHSSQANCVFHLEDGNCLVVRAVTDLQKNTEVLIDYGSSARPTWKCLTSYGFFHPHEPSLDGTGNSEDEEEHHVAEVYIDGIRYEVGPTTIPEDMVAAIASQEDFQKVDNENNNIEFTPEIAIRLGRRISDVAFNMLLDPWDNSKIVYDCDDVKGKSDSDSEENEDRSVMDTVTAEEILSSKLAASFRFNQHRILLACSMGLRDWAVQQQNLPN